MSVAHATTAPATEEARTDGEHLGEAVASLYDAQSVAEADAALGDVHAAARTAREHAGDRIGDQFAADDFRSYAPEVRQAFSEGHQDGLAGS